MTAAPATVVDGAPTEVAEVLDRTGSGATEEVTHRYERSPRDVLRLVVYGATTLGGIGLVHWLEDSVLGLEEDIIRLFNFLSPSIERLVGGALEWCTALILAVLLAIPLITKRYRLFWYILASSALAGALMAVTLWLLDRKESDVLANEIAQRAGITHVTAGSLQAYAATTAAFVAVGPFVSARWRRAGVITLVLLALAHFVLSAELPAGLVVAIPLGAACGVAVLLAFGRPDRRPTINAIRTALVSSGLAVAAVHPAQVDARGSTPYFATLDDGGGLFVKVLGEDQRAADLLFRAYRFVRLKGVGDYRPFSSLRRTVEHEALLSLFARDGGIRTPRLRGVVDVGMDSMVLAYDQVDGSSFDRLPDEQVTDDLMRKVWAQVALLRSRRIAHRDLRRANLFVADDHQPWLIDFGFSELAVPDAILEADVAQLLASFVVVAGPERTVSAAVDVLGRDAVAEALPRLQINALSGATQTALKERKGLLGELQREVEDRCQVTQVHFEELHRFDSRMLITIGVVVGVTYFLLPQFADLPEILRQVRDADWAWLPLIILMSVFTYIGATISMTGAVPDRLAAGPTMATQVASSFASKLAPGGLGGMALNVRYLQKQGVERAVAVSSVGLNSIGGFIAHTSLVVIFVIWAGKKAFGSFRLPDVHWFLLGAAVALVFLAIGFALPYSRHLIVGKLLPILGRAAHGIGDVMRRPSKLALLLGGSALVTTSYLVGLYLSTVAFGGDLPFATVGAVYLVGSAVASAAPTPGGLGAVEAALIGGLVAAGMENSVAVPAVFLFRLCTFWLPILPGWLCFTWLQRTDHI
jgi:undecaprenyl-diphosphatase